MKPMELFGWVVFALIIGSAADLYDMRVCLKPVGQCNGGNGNSLVIQANSKAEAP